MEQADFERRVRMRVGAIYTPGSVDYAIRHYVDHVGRLHEEDIRHCVQLVGLFDENSRASAQPASQTVEHRLKAERTIVNEARLRQIQPWIDMLRKALLGEAKAPFTSLAAAVGWLHHVLRQAYDWSPEAAARYLSLPDEEQAAVLALFTPEALPLEEYLAEQLWCLREALRAGSIYTGMRAFEGWNEGDPPVELSPLHQWLNWVNIQLSDIAATLGCSDAEILAYALANVRPALSPVTIGTRLYAHTPPGDTQPMQRTEVTITVRSRLTLVELRDLFSQLGQVLNVTKARPLTAEDHRFLEVVHQGGAPPFGKGSGAKAFWEQFLLQWKRMGGVPSYTDWRNPRIRYTRLMRRLRQIAA
jgi:hypothetical protein